MDGDFNNDGSFDAADYVVWRKDLGTQEDYNFWRTNFGRTAAGAASLVSGAASAVPEANSIALLLVGLLSLAAAFRRRAPAA